MILGKFQLTESTELEFQMDIYGTTEKANQVRFVIEGKDFDISCRCNVDKGEIKAVIPKLKGILESGVYDTRLEIVVDNKIFVPLKESVEFEPNIEFGVQKKGATAIKEGVKVSLKAPIHSEDITVNPLQEEMTKLESSGYEVVDMNGFRVIKKSRLYHGIVSESKILKTDIGYDTINELVEALSK
jgi:hypothetical protein